MKVVADNTGEILCIGRDQRNQFWHPRNPKYRKVQWMQLDGEEFDLQKRLLFFFNEEDKNLGNYFLFFNAQIFFQETKMPSFLQTKKTISL